MTDDEIAADAPQWNLPAASSYAAQWSEPDASGRRYMTAPPRAGDEPPRWLPWYGAPFIGSLRRFVTGYARFAGRASRSEFWWPQLGVYLGNQIVQIPYVIGFFLTTTDLARRQPRDGAAPAHQTSAEAFRQLLGAVNPVLVVGVVLVAVWGLALIVPMLSLTARRLHDTGRRAWWILLVLVPLVGQVVLVVFCCLDPEPRGQRFDRPTGAPA